MKNMANKLKVFSGSASQKLAAAICKKLDIPLGAMTTGRFSDGEISVKIEESVRGADVFVVQSTSSPVNENLMELLVIIDALKRASAGRINAVIPYFGYARQDRKASPRDPITAKLVADLIEVAGANRVLTMDLHSGQIQGFFNFPLDHLFGIPVLKKSIIKEKIFDGKKECQFDQDLVVVSPDIGSVARARDLAGRINAPLAIVDKRRQKANESEVMHIIGDIAGKVCLLLDDMIDTAGTIVNSAEALVKNGAAKVYAACTHAVLSGPAIERIEKSCIEKLFTLDTIDIPSEKRIKKLAEFSVASIFAEAIESIYLEKPVSKLYD